jgi:hypothetical protein
VTSIGGERREAWVLRAFEDVRRGAVWLVAGWADQMTWCGILETSIELSVLLSHDRGSIWMIL